MKRLLVLALVLVAINAFAGTVNLQWSTVSDPSVTGYRVCWNNYSGNIRNFPATNCISTSTTVNTATFSSLNTALQDFYFRVQSRSVAVDSLWSNVPYVHFILAPANNTVIGATP